MRSLNSASETENLIFKMVLKIRQHNSCLENFKETKEVNETKSKEVQNLYQLMEKEQIKIILKELEQIYYKVKSNSFNVFGEYDEKVGLAIYLKLPELSHSCVPNAEIVFEGNNMLIKSKVNNRLKDFTNLTISYASRCQKYSEIQEQIQKLFGNNCCCLRCEQLRKVQRKVQTSLHSALSLLQKCYMSHIEENTEGKNRDYFSSIK